MNKEETFTISFEGQDFCVSTTPLVAILYQGCTIKMSSGKCGWPSVGAAKNALRNEFYNLRHEIKDWESFYKLFEFKEIGKI